MSYCRDRVSLYEQIGKHYEQWAFDDYMIYNDCEKCFIHMYLYILSMSVSYNFWKSGEEIKNPAIINNRNNDDNTDKILFSALAVNEFELFEEYSVGISGDILKAMYNEDYDSARNLVEKLPDSMDMYIRYKHRMSYYYQTCFMKDLYLSIINGDEKSFNNALMVRIKNIRQGYILPIDTVSISMIKLANKRNINYYFDVIEIPKYFLSNDIKINKTLYTLPNININ